MQPVNVAQLLEETATELAEAEQRAAEATRRVEYLRGQRDALVRIIQLSQERTAIITEGEA